MSKYRNHREPRRQGYGDDSNQVPEPTYFQREVAQPAAVTSSPPVEVEVLWFNADKGFGFVKAADDTNIFLHARVFSDNDGYATAHRFHRRVSKSVFITWMNAYARRL